MYPPDLPPKTGSIIMLGSGRKILRRRQVTSGFPPTIDAGSAPDLMMMHTDLNPSLQATHCEASLNSLLRSRKTTNMSTESTRVTA
jgi:hypothetical protein